MAPYIEHGEKRVLMADGSIIGCYERQGNLDHRTTAAGDASQSVLTPMSKPSAGQLPNRFGQGRSFYWNRLVYPYIVEINVVNPEASARCSHLANLLAGPVLDALGLISP